jgi:hypothetical protein
MSELLRHQGRGRIVGRVVARCIGVCCSFEAPARDHAKDRDHALFVHADARLLQNIAVNQQTNNC